MLTLLIVKEIVFILALLTLPTYMIYAVYTERKRYKKQESLVVSVANKLLEKADDEKPIMLNVDVKNLTEEVVNEIERRKALEGRF